MSGELDRDSRAVLELARAAEQSLPRDPERVRQRVLVAVGVAAAVASASTPAGASSMAPTVPTAAKLAGTGLFGGLKLVGLASVALAIGAGAYLSSAPETANRDAASTPARAAVPPQSQPAVAPLTEPAPPSPPPVVALDALPVLERTRAAAAATPGPAAVGSPRASDAMAADGERIDAKPTDLSSRSAAASNSNSNTTSMNAGKAMVTAEAETKTEERDERDELDAKVASQPASLREDLQLLAQAQRALNAGQAGQALELVRRVRGGQLSAERAALQVFALCQLGRRDEAVQQAERFRSMAPHSPLLPRVNASCAKP